MYILVLWIASAGGDPRKTKIIKNERI